MGVGSALEAFPGVFETPWFALTGGPVILPIISRAIPPLHILHRIQQPTRKGISAGSRAAHRVVHAAARHPFVIATLRPPINLRKLACGAGEYRGPLHYTKLDIEAEVICTRKTWS
jgi:hypothetical protein